MIMVATQNFRSVDRLLAAPGRAGAQVETMGHDAARAFLRYQVSEQNRWYFETWEKIQLALGVAVLAALIRQGRLTVGLAAVVAFLIGQLIDITVFHRIRRATGERHIWLRATGSTAVSQLIDSFVVLYIAFVIGPQHWPMGLFLAGRLIFGRERIGNQVDVVDEADHSHIDR